MQKWFAETAGGGSNMVTDAKVRWAGGHGSSPTDAANTQNAAGELPSAFVLLPAAAVMLTPLCAPMRTATRPREADGRGRGNRPDCTKEEPRGGSWGGQIVPSTSAHRHGCPYCYLGRCVSHGTGAGRGHARPRLPSQERGAVRRGIL